MAEYVKPLLEDSQATLNDMRKYADTNAPQINPQQITVADYARLLNSYNNSLQDPAMEVQKQNLNNLYAIASIYNSGMNNNSIQQTLPMMTHVLQGNVDVAKSRTASANARQNDLLAQQAMQAYGNSNNIQDAMLFSSLMHKAGAPVSDRLLADQSLSEKERQQVIQNLLALQQQAYANEKSLAMQEYSTKQSAENAAAARAQADAHFWENIDREDKRNQQKIIAEMTKLQTPDVGGLWNLIHSIMGDIDNFNNLAPEAKVTKQKALSEFLIGSFGNNRNYIPVVNDIGRFYGLDMNKEMTNYRNNNEQAIVDRNEYAQRHQSGKPRPQLPQNNYMSVNPMSNIYIDPTQW